MAPIRVGFIGLSGASPEVYEGTSWASIAHLPYLKKSPYFEIVALLNTTVESARTAIRRYELPTDTKAYCNPEDFGSDPDIDLVVCCVRVDRHFQTVKPSIMAGKTVLVEWPMDRNLKVAQEMAQLASKHNSKSIIGLQGSFSPIVGKLKEIVESGKVGKILASSVSGSTGNLGAQESKNVRYFLDRHIGGNPISIHLGHSLEVLTSVLGDIQSFVSSIALRRESIDIVDRGAGNKILNKAVPNTVPDQIIWHGRAARDNAIVSMTLHGGQAFPGAPAFIWRIEGEKGQLMLTSPSFVINVGNAEAKLEFHNFSNQKVEILIPEPDEWDELPLAAQNIARLYEAYRTGSWYPDFNWALKHHVMIEKIWRQFDEESKTLA